MLPEENLASQANQAVDGVLVMSVRTFHDRIAHIESEMRRHAIDFEFMFEHDAADLDAALVERTFGSADGLSQGACSLILKNIAAWRLALARGWKTVLIVEDDALLDPHFNARFVEAMAASRQLEPGWLVFLGGLDTKVPDRYFLAPGPLVELPIATTEAYVSDAEAMRRRLAWLEAHQVGDALDLLLRRIDKDLGIRQYWLIRPIVEQGSVVGLFDSALDAQRRKHSRMFNVLRNRWNKFQRRHARSVLVRLRHYLTGAAS